MSSRSLNRVTLIGNLTRDPELKYTPSGTAVCTFGVATNRSWTTATGELKEDVQYHRLVAWQKLAELCGKILAKGKKVYLEGRITYRNYTGKDSVQRSITEIVLEDFVVLDTKRPTDQYSSHQEEKPTTVPSHTPPSKTDTGSGATTETTVSSATNTDESTTLSTEEKINPDDIPF